jgi:hypothetical protein
MISAKKRDSIPFHYRAQSYLCPLAHKLSSGESFGKLFIATIKY